MVKASIPKQLTPSAIANAFLALVAERYPSGDKVRALAHGLGIERSLDAQIVVFSVMRDAVREVSKDYVYRSLQHRDEIFNAIIEALEELEDEKAEEEERLSDELDNWSDEEGVT